MSSQEKSYRSRTRKMYLNPWRAFKDGREINDFTRDQVTTIISFSCKKQHLIWKLQSNCQQSNTRQTHFEKDVATELLKFKCTMCFGYRGEIQLPSEMTQPLSAASPQASAGLFVSGLSFVLLRILLAVQISFTPPPMG